MPIHPAVKQSFFIKVLLITAFVGNVYVSLQAFFHTINVHVFDLYLRWYGFKAPFLWNAILFAGTGITLLGIVKIYREGLHGYKIYVIGKCITCLAYILLMVLEYRISNLDFPYILLPVIVVLQSIYPILLYLSLRKRPNRGESTNTLKK